MPSSVQTKEKFNEAASNSRSIKLNSLLSSKAN